MIDRTLPARSSGAPAAASDTSSSGTGPQASRTKEPGLALVTRPEGQAAETIAALREAGIEAIAAPLLAVLPVEASLPEGPIQAVLLTSANGAEALSRIDAGRYLRILAVGDATARKARELGHAQVDSAGGDVTTLAELATSTLSPEGGPLVHVAASEVAGNLQGSLSAAGFEVKRVVAYRTERVREMPFHAASALRENQVAQVLFFSPRTTQSFVTLARQAGLEDKCASVRAICLSPAVAREASRIDWAEVVVADRPNQASLIRASARTDAVGDAEEIRTGASETVNSTDKKKEADGEVPADASPTASKTSASATATAARPKEAASKPGASTPGKSRSASSVPAADKSADTSSGKSSARSAAESWAIWFVAAVVLLFVVLAVVSPASLRGLLALEQDPTLRTLDRRLASIEGLPASGAPEAISEMRTSIESLSNEVQALGGRLDQDGSTGRLSGIEEAGQTASKERESLKARMDDVVARLDSQSSSLEEAAASRESLVTAVASLEKSTGGRAEAAAALEKKTDDIEQRLAALEEQVRSRAPERIAESLIAIGDLRQVITSGDPYSAALDRVSSATGSESIAGSRLAASATEGVPGIEDLTEELVRVVETQRGSRARPFKSDVGWLDRGIGWALSGVEVEHKGERASGDAAAAAVGAMRERDVETAVAKIESLPDDNREPYASWLEDAKRRVAVLADVDRLEDEVVSTATGSKP